MAKKNSSAPFSMEIPHLKPGQKGSDWRGLYIAATLLLEETQKIGYLPIAVDRTPADQKWAFAAAEKDKLADALDELELRLDGKKNRFQAMGDFFNLQPSRPVTSETLSEFFFGVREAGIAANVTNDLIALKFIQHIPGGNKLFTDQEDKIDTDMKESDLIGLFDEAKKRLIKVKGSNKQSEMVPVDVFHVKEPDPEPMPEWAKELKLQVLALEASLHARSSTDSTSGSEELQNSAFYAKSKNSKGTSKEVKTCSICGKSNHSAKRCYKRICTKCSGKGHDADKCATRGNRSRKG